MGGFGWQPSVYCRGVRSGGQTHALPAAGLRSVTIHRALIGRLYPIKSFVATSLTGVAPVTAYVDKCCTVDTRHLTDTFNE